MPTKQTNRKRRNGKAPRRASANGRIARTSHAFVIDEAGSTTHVLIPIEEYERLVVADMAQGAAAKLAAPDADWMDYDDFRLEEAANRIVKARKAAKLTQQQLGDKLGLPQSQISRIERNPDRTTIRTLRRIAKALRVDVGDMLRGL